MIVKFNSVEEFLEELEKEKDNIKRRIVRLTNSSAMSAISPSIHHFSVVATFTCTDGMLVRLDRFCGDTWRIERQDKPVIVLSNKISKQITEKCQELGLEVRSGLIEEPLSSPV